MRPGCWSGGLLLSLGCQHNWHIKLTSTTRSHEAACVLIVLLGIDRGMHNANIITIKNFLWFCLYLFFIFFSFFYILIFFLFFIIIHSIFFLLFLIFFSPLFYLFNSFSFKSLLFLKLCFMPNKTKVYCMLIFIDQIHSLNCQFS